MLTSTNKKGDKSNRKLKFLYTNADQYVNKRDTLLAMIAEDEPDVIMITEVIPKGQVNPIAIASIHMAINYTQISSRRTQIWDPLESEV